MAQKKLPKAFKKQMLWYIALVSVFSITFIIISNQLWFEPISKTILGGYASISSVILNLMGQQTIVNDGSIISSGYSIAIKKGCDALAPMLLYLFSVSFFKAPLKHKVKGILVGLPILAVLNIIRICTLFLVGKYGSQAFFDIMHVDVWQIFFIIFTLIIWVQWLKRTDLIPHGKG